MFVEKNIYIKSVGWTFVCLSIVFSFCMVDFFVGNHDYRFLRSGIIWDSGFFEGRFTQFIFPWLFLENHILPILSLLLGFFFISMALPVVAQFWRVGKKTEDVVLFSLLVGLNPYFLSQIYYVHQFLSIGIWILFAILGVQLLYEYKNLKTVVLGAFLLFVAISGYIAVIELVLVLLLGRFCIDLLNTKKDVRSLVKLYIRPVLIVLGLCVIFYLLISYLREMGFISRNMYNTQLLLGVDLLKRFVDKFYIVYGLWWEDIPYLSRMANIIIFVFIAFFLYISWVKKRFFIMVLTFIALTYSSCLMGLLNPNAGFLMVYRINLYSVPFVIGLLFVIAFNNMDNKGKNISYILALLLLLMFVKADFLGQKVWHLGNQQDNLLIDRVKEDVDLVIEKDKKYALSVVGGIYGRQKFYGTSIIRDREKYREYYGGSFYLAQMFSAGFSLYDEENIFWSEFFPFFRKFFIWNDTTRNENKMSGGILFDREISKKETDALSLVTLRKYPKEKYIYIDDEDVVLMFSEDLEETKDKLRKIFFEKEKNN